MTDRHGIARPAGLPHARRGAPVPGHATPEGNETIGYLGGGLFVTAQTADDLSFVHSSWEQGIEPWRFNLPTVRLAGAAQRPDGARPAALPRRRDRLDEARDPAPGASRPRRASRRPTGRPSSRSATRAATRSTSCRCRGTPRGSRRAPGRSRRAPSSAATRSRWRSPAERWQPPGQTETLVSGTFRVEEFRVPLMRATLKPPADPLVAVSEFPARHQRAVSGRRRRRRSSP